MFGQFPKDFQDGQVKYLYLDMERKVAEFLPGLEIPLRPFPGTIGVARAEPGRYSSVPPGEYAGNMDIRELTEGATLYVPVWVKGALLWSGDSHAAQGNGEVILTDALFADDTRHIVNARTLGLMKPTAYLVNTSRGPMVDVQALAQLAGQLAHEFVDGGDVDGDVPAGDLLVVEGDGEGEGGEADEEPEDLLAGEVAGGGEAGGVGRAGGGVDHEKAVETEAEDGGEERPVEPFQEAEVHHGRDSVGRNSGRADPLQGRDRRVSPAAP